MPVTVRGGRELETTLGQAADDVGKTGRASAKSATEIATGARARAPRRTGALIASIRARPVGPVAVVSVGVRYAAPVHWGVPGRGIPAQPFLLDAAEAATPQVVDNYRRDVSDAVAKVKGA